MPASDEFCSLEVTAGGETADGVESWSRGTRVFERRDGERAMTHQHVSFPYEPETGAAATGLAP